MIKDSSSYGIGLGLGLAIGFGSGISIGLVTGLASRGEQDGSTSETKLAETLIIAEDRNVPPDGIPEYIVQELRGGKYVTTKILQGSLNERGEVVYLPERMDNPFP